MAPIGSYIRSLGPQQELFEKIRRIRRAGEDQSQLSCLLEMVRGEKGRHPALVSG